MIPKNIHFLFGLDKTFGGKEFTFFHFLNILSCIKLHPEYEVYIHYFYEPTSFWWKLTKQICISKVLLELPTEFYGSKIIQYAHIADWIRLDILEKHGGIYLDIDVLCIQNLTPFLNYDFVMGEEMFCGNKNGLCNAVIFSEKNHEFIKQWKNEFKSFNNLDWNKMAVRVPYEISKKMNINIQPYSSFFKYDWHTITDIFNEDGNFTPDMYCVHMWESKLYHSILKNISPTSINSFNCIYNKFVNNLYESTSICKKISSF